MIQKLINLFKRDSLSKLIKKADKRYYETGKQYLVLPFNKKGKLILVHGTTFLNGYNKKAKKMGYPKMTYPQMLEKAVYKTNPGTLNKR
jgi:hypothetical protein